MARLTQNDYWNQKYQTQGISTRKSFLSSSWLGRKIGNLKRDLADTFLWENLYPQVWQDVSQKNPERTPKVVEVGSAPGTHMMRFAQTFGGDVYGIEYAAAGAQINRKIFAQAGLNPENVIEDDFFSASLQEKQTGQFDIIISRGFIEHFTDPRDAVLKHVNLLKKGGTLIVSIPNFSGINAMLMRFFNPKVLALHNLDIMNLATFRSLFLKMGLEEKNCQHLGTFQFGLFSTESKKRSFKRFLWKVGVRLQPMINIVSRILFGKKGLATKWTSPYLIYIGIKS